MRSFIEIALQGDSDAFTSIFEMASLEDAEAIQCLAEVIVAEPTLLFSFSRFFSDHEYSEAVLKISRNPAFNLSPLKTWIEKTPPALMVVAGLAQSGNESVRRMIPELKFDPESYQNTVNQDPDYLPYLTLMAEAGYKNVARLLAQLVWGGSEVILSSVVGIAAQGSQAAFEALNLGITAGHLSTLVRLAEQYGDDPVYGTPLRKVLQSPAFCPYLLPFPKEDEFEMANLLARLANLNNPSAQEWIQSPPVKAVGQ